MYGKFSGLFLIATAFLIVTLAGCGPKEQEKGQARVILAERGPIQKDAFLQDYNFTSDWFTPNIPLREKAMAPYKGKRGIHYLEVGTYEGCSVV